MGRDCWEVVVVVVEEEPRPVRELETVSWEKKYFVTLFSKCHVRTFPRNLTNLNRLRVDSVSDNKSLLFSPD